MLQRAGQFDTELNLVPILELLCTFLSQITPQPRSSQPHLILRKSTRRPSATSTRLQTYIGRFWKNAGSFSFKKPISALRLTRTDLPCLLAFIIVSQPFSICFTRIGSHFSYHFDSHAQFWKIRKPCKQFCPKRRVLA